MNFPENISKLIDRKTAIKVGLILCVLLISIAVHISNRQSDVVVVSAGESQEDLALADLSGDAEAQTDKSVPIYVDISGEVKSPGVYEVPAETRLFELIERAGGLTDEADIDSINQAAYVADGDKVVIPVKGGEGITRGTAGITAAQGNGTVNINTAGKEELMELPGVGDVIADRIIEYRETNRFRQIEDIKNVTGIGDATFEKMKGKLSV